MPVLCLCSLDMKSRFAGPDIMLSVARTVQGNADTDISARVEQKTTDRCEDNSYCEEEGKHRLWR